MHRCHHVHFRHGHSPSSVKRTSAQYAIRLCHLRVPMAVKPLVKVTLLSASNSTSRRQHPDQIDRILQWQLMQRSRRVLLARGKVKLPVGAVFRTAVGEEGVRVQGAATTTLSSGLVVRGDAWRVWSLTRRQKKTVWVKEGNQRSVSFVLRNLSRVPRWVGWSVCASSTRYDYDRSHATF